MKALLLLLPVCLWLSLKTSAQSPAFTVSGTLVSQNDQQPIPAASVYISGSSLGDISQADGSFRIVGVPTGKYDLIVSLIGFQSVDYTLQVNDQDLKIRFIMIPEASTLSEVVVNAKGRRNRDLALFLKYFLGQDYNAGHTRILNDSVLNFGFTASGELTAEATGMLLIRNDALGYLIHYTLKDFSFNTKTGFLRYRGFPLFTEIKDLKFSIQRKCLSRREDTYEVSALRFFRMLGRKELDETEFVMGVPVAYEGAFPPGAGTTMTFDGQRYYLKSFPVDSIPYNNLIYPVKGTGNYRLSFSGYLAIALVDDPTKVKLSIIRLNTSGVVIDRNGNIEDASDLFFDGFWMSQRVADLLPVNYVPRGM